MKSIFRKPIQRLFPKIISKKKLELLYFNPLKTKKLKQNNILFHLFEDYKNNYFELVRENDIYYYNMNNIAISKDTVDKIEMENKNKRKMNMLFRMNN